MLHDSWLTREIATFKEFLFRFVGNGGGTRVCVRLPMLTLRFRGKRGCHDVKHFVRSDGREGRFALPMRTLCFPVENCDALSGKAT